MEKNSTAKDGTQPPSAPDLNTNCKYINAIEPRYQWEANGGYCGEVSMISAGLYFGQYLSQYDVRTLAWESPDADNNANKTDNRQSVQLLLGNNDAWVAQKLKLDAEVCEVRDSIAFLKWVKKNVVSGYPVIIGVFNNENLVYPGEGNPGDPQYDHIVPVVAWGSPGLNEDDIMDDVLLLSDNGLYGPDLGPVPNISVKYYYHYRIHHFLANRAQANEDRNRVYSLLNLPDNGNPSHRNYAIAIKGVSDKLKETLRVSLTTSINYEDPAVKKGSQMRPGHQPVILTITISGLTPGQTYNLHRYHHEKDVPVENFNAKPGKAWQKIEATTEVWTGSLRIKSNDKVFFRVVNINAG